MPDSSRTEYEGAIGGTQGHRSHHVELNIAVYAVDKRGKCRGGTHASTDAKERKARHADRPATSLFKDQWVAGEIEI
jgi:hypothetical protein